jgi:hypothetical protein
MPKEFASARRRVPDLVAVQTAEGLVYPGGGDAKACTTKGGKLRACHVEVVFLTGKRAVFYGVAPGAYLRVCKRFGEKGKVIPVRDHDEATRLSHASCVAPKRAKAKRRG